MFNDNISDILQVSIVGALVLALASATLGVTPAPIF